MNLKGIATKIEFPEHTPPLGYALFVHCFTCTKDSIAPVRISKALSRHGFAVVQFDFIGLGVSEGDFPDTNFSTNITDIIKVVDTMREKFEAPKLLVGHSLGGAAILSAAAHIPEAQAVVTIGAPSDPSHLSRIVKGNEDAFEKEGQVEVELGGRPFIIKKQFIDDIKQYNPLDSLGELKKSLLILHSPTDSIVSIDNAHEIYEAAKHPKSFISLADADHLLTNRRDVNYVADVISAWASRYVDLKQPEKETIGEDGVVIVKESDRGKFAQDIINGANYFTADEPKDFGGNNTGPTPYGLLLASLGACTSMTIRMYANFKKLPLKSVSVKLRHEKIHPQDCEQCETKDGKIDRIERELILEGDLTEEQRSKLLEIANKCPIHRTLHGEVDIITKLK